eukprot:Sdes_comp23447_c0_seq1m21697
MNESLSETCLPFKCDYCPAKKFNSEKMYFLHLLSKKHVSRMRRQLFPSFQCFLCKVQISDFSCWNLHLISRNHLNLLAKHSVKNISCIQPFTMRQVFEVENSFRIQETD